MPDIQNGKTQENFGMYNKIGLNSISLLFHQYHRWDNMCRNRFYYKFTTSH